MTKKGGGGRTSSPTRDGWRTKGGRGRGGSGGLSQDTQEALDALTKAHQKKQKKKDRDKLARRVAALNSKATKAKRKGKQSSSSSVDSDDSHDDSSSSSDSDSDTSSGSTSKKKKKKADSKKKKDKKPTKDDPNEGDSTSKQQRKRHRKHERLTSSLRAAHLERDQATKDKEIAEAKLSAYETTVQSLTFTQDNVIRKPEDQQGTPDKTFIEATITAAVEQAVSRVVKVRKEPSGFDLMLARFAEASSSTLSDASVDLANPRASEISCQLKTLAERVPRERWADNSIRISPIETALLTTVSKVLSKAFRTPADASELKWIGAQSESLLRTTCSNPNTKICYALKFARHHEVDFCFMKDLGLTPEEVETQVVGHGTVVTASKTVAPKAPPPVRPKTRSGKGGT